MDSVANAEDVGTVARVPEGSVVAEVGLGGQEHRERQFVGGGRGNEVEIRRVDRLGAGTEGGELALSFAV